MEKGQSQSKANKGMHRFFLGRSSAILVVPILLSMLVFDHLKKKKKSAEKESTVGASAPLFSTDGAFDVFLSFRGLDTRKEFTDHLYHRLHNAGSLPIFVFKDDESLPIGEEFGSKLLNAITRSKISIPIISENYASSKWCLRELIHIMDCKKKTSHIVLPIFYKVAPSDVRHLTGNFGKAFESHKKHFDKYDIQEGKRALEEVSYLNGWESTKIANGREGELVEKVIQMVLSKLRPDFHLDVTEHLVGFGDHVKNIRNWVNTSASSAGGARMIGICGMGGIGKTTLAKVIYNELSIDFEHCSFLPDIRERAQHGIAYLQKQLIKDMSSVKGDVHGPRDGISLIKASCKGKKVLILLDDLDHSDHLNALARQCNWFTPGSIIIVTTRNKAILEQSEFKIVYKYELEGIGGKDSLILFKKHAFREDQSSKGFENISNKIISTLDGLPLAIEVIGSYLYKKDQKVWDDMLNQFKKRPHVDVQAKLKISYDALDEGQKEIFLHIASFFIGKESKFAICMWEDYGFSANQAIEELKLRCLIKVGDDGMISMHDQLRDLGRSIRQEKDKKGAEMFLQWRGAGSSGDFNEQFSELRWLQWLDIECDLSFSTANLSLSSLVVLQLSYNEIRDNWRGWTLIMVAKRLKVLDLACCEYLTRSPDLSTFKELKILILKGCHQLEQVHPSISEVNKLVIFDLSGCGSLKELPREVRELVELEELILDSSGITEIPMSIGSLRKLKKLSVRACRSLGKIPSSIWDLQNLQNLDISESAIEELLGAIGRLQKPDLKAFAELKIILKDCYKLKLVHPSIGKVNNLVSLDLSGCGSLKDLPGEVCGLEELEELILDSTGITEIPTSIGYLRKLKKLSARTCRLLGKIPSSIWDLQNLQNLDISESAIEELLGAIGRLQKPDLKAFAELKIILKDCYKLKLVHPSIGKVNNLVFLDLSGCGSLKDLPGEVCELEELEELILDSTGITEIPMSIGYLRKLKKLSARTCWLLGKIPCSIWDLQNLQNLDISESAIEELLGAIGRLQKPDLKAFVELKIILKDCYKLKLVHPSIGKVNNLVSLDLSGCGSLKDLPGEVCELEELEELILDSTGITEIPTSIGYLRKLKKLSARTCRLLGKIPSSIWFLQNLQYLDISESVVEEFPNIQNLSSLQHLSLEGCHKLRSMSELPSGLKFLRISAQSPMFPHGCCPLHVETLHVSWTRL